MSERVAKKVARALATSNPLAGQSYSVEKPQSISQRAANMLAEVGPYGPYIAPGDPYGWSPGALATIFMEPKGGEGDCVMPLDYWNGGGEAAERASTLMGKYYIEFVNAAVAAVWEG